MKRAAGTALSVIVVCCLIIISHLEATETQEHSNITLFYHAPSLCATRDAQAHSERQVAGVLPGCRVQPGTAGLPGC